jgi:hypothetical protein
MPHEQLLGPNHPEGQITDLPVQPRLKKYFHFLSTQITGLFWASHPS